MFYLKGERSDDTALRELVASGFRVRVTGRRHNMPAQVAAIGRVAPKNPVYRSAKTMPGVFISERPKPSGNATAKRLPSPAWVAANPYKGPRDRNANRAEDILYKRALEQLQTVFKEVHSQHPPLTTHFFNLFPAERLLAI